MKTLLAVFIAYLCCSFILNMTRISLTSTTSSKMTTSQRQKNTLRIGGLLRSKNGKFEVHMRSDCNLVITSTETNKILWSTNTKGMGVECFATIQPDGFFVIKNKNNVVVWSSQSSLKYGRDGPYRVRITDTGNLTIHDHSKRYVWGAFGLPLPDEVKQATMIPSQKSVEILFNFIKKIKQRMRNFPTLPYGLYPHKHVKNTIPHVKKGDRPKKTKVKILQMKVDNDAIKESGLRTWIRVGNKGWNKWKRMMKNKGIHKGRLIMKVKRAFQSGNVSKILKVLAKIAKKKISKLHEVQKKKIEYKKKKKISVLASIMKLTWFQKVKDILSRGNVTTRKGLRKIKRILQKNNFIGTKPWWKKVSKSVSKDNFNTFIKKITTPPLPPNPPRVIVRKHPKVAPKPIPHSIPAKIKPKRKVRIASWHLVLRMRLYLTYYWRRIYDWNRQCEFCTWSEWWWWGQAQCIWYSCPGWVYYPHWYWASYYYWQWERVYKDKMIDA